MDILDYTGLWSSTSSEYVLPIGLLELWDRSASLSLNERIPELELSDRAASLHINERTPELVVDERTTELVLEEK